MIDYIRTFWSDWRDWGLKAAWKNFLIDFTFNRIGARSIHIHYTDDPKCTNNCEYFGDYTGPM
mgnify:CR=1 FL=1